MSILIREANSDDRAAVFELVRQFSVSFVPTRTDFDSSFARLRDNKDAWMGVAEVDGQVLGYCLGFGHDTCFANGPVAWVEEIMVRPDHRKRGVGRALMNAFEHHARLRGARLVALATRRAAGFYAALGYHESASYFRKLL
jgi:GNAT superfamily N-acetyltransferase